MIIAALAALGALTTAPIAPPAEQPPDAVRISTADLPARPAQGAELARRVDVAVSDYCRASARVSRSMGQQALCRDAVRRFVEARLPEPVRTDVRIARRSARR